MSTPPRHSVLIPIVEEVQDLARLHEELCAALDALEGDSEVLYLLDSSVPNGAEEALLAIQASDPLRTRVLTLGTSGGRAALLSAGFDESHGEVLLTVPQTREVDLRVLRALVEAIGEGADVAIACRSTGSRLDPSLQVSRWFNRLVSLASGRRYRDVASHTRALRRLVADEIPLYGDFDRYLPLLAERHGFVVREIPAQVLPTASKRVNRDPRTYLWRAMDVLTIFFISRFTRHPLRLFGSVGSTLALLGAGILAVVGVQRLLGTPLADRPVLVLGTLLLGLGFQAFTLGLLGELILFFHARQMRDYRIAAVYEADRGESGTRAQKLSPLRRSDDVG